MVDVLAIPRDSPLKDEKIKSGTVPFFVKRIGTVLSKMSMRLRTVPLKRAGQSPFLFSKLQPLAGEIIWAKHLVIIWEEVVTTCDDL